MPEDKIPIRQFADLIGVSRETLHRWDRFGYLIPAVRAVGNKGRAYDPSQIAEAERLRDQFFKSPEGERLRRKAASPRGRALVQVVTELQKEGVLVESGGAYQLTTQGKEEKK